MGLLEQAPAESDDPERGYHVGWTSEALSHGLVEIGIGPAGASTGNWSLSEAAHPEHKLDWARAVSLAHTATEEKATLNHKPKSRTFTCRSWQWGSGILVLLPREHRQLLFNEVAVFSGTVHPRLGEAFAHPGKRGEDVEGASRQPTLIGLHRTSHCHTVLSRNGKRPGRTGKADLNRLQEKHLLWARKMLPEAIKNDAKPPPTEAARQVLDASCQDSPPTWCRTPPWAFNKA